MSNDRINPSKDEVLRTLRGITTLSPSERALIAEVIQRIKQSGVGHAEFHKELYRLRSKHAISETDMAAIEDAFFPDEEE